MTIGLGGNVGGGGSSIGDAVTGGTANRVLYIDASGNLADSANLTFVNGVLTVGTRIVGPNGSAGAVSFGSAADLGFYFTTNGSYFSNGSGGSAAIGFGNAQNGVVLYSSWGYKWGSGDASSAADTGLSRNAAGVVEVNSGTAGTYRDLIARTLVSAPSSANAQKLEIKSLTELTTIAAAATTDTTIQIPANAIVLAVSVRVTVVIPTAATFTVIGTTSSTAFNTAAVSTAANTTDKGTAAGAYVNTTAQTIRITPNLTPADNTGRVRVTIHYIEITPPTS